MYRFLTGNYASNIEISAPSSVALYRGYTFQVVSPIIIHGLIGGVDRFGTLAEDQKGGHIAIYDSNTSGVPLSIKRSVNMTKLGRKQFFPINPIALVPGEWYMIAAGAKLGTTFNNNSLSAIGYWDVGKMIEQEPFLKSWEPTTGGGLYQMWVWTNPESQGPPSGILGRTPVTGGSVSDARPDIGFEYVYDNLIRVFVDDDEVEFPDAKPFFDEQGRIMIPMRFVYDAIGATTTWHPELQVAEVIYGSLTLILLVGDNKIVIPGHDTYHLSYEIALHEDRVVLWDQDIMGMIEAYQQEETKIIDLIHHVRYSSAFGNIWTRQPDWERVPEVSTKQGDAFVKTSGVWTRQGSDWKVVT